MSETKEYQILKELLAKNEQVGVEIREHKLGGGRLFEPAHVYATNQRLIIIRRYLLGISQSMKIIKYNHITEVRVERGMRYCRIHFSLIGEQQEKSENLKWVNGLKYGEALKLIQYINKIQELPVEMTS